MTEEQKQEQQTPQIPQIPQILQWGLTGNIGSGKSTVAKWLAEKGAAIIDADAIAKQATADPKVLEEIAKALGSELVKDGVLDRAATAEKVFADKDALAILNSITHPWIAVERERQVQEQLSSDNPPALIIHDIPLLYEVGADAIVDGVIVVYAPLEIRVERVRERSGFSEEDIRARDAKQLSLDEKVKRADIVIDNSGTLEDLQKELDTKLSNIEALSVH